MYELVWAKAAQETYEDLKAKAAKALANRKAKKKSKSSPAEGLFKQIHKCVTLLQSNPKHPGLRTHEFTSLSNPFDQQAKVFEAYAQSKTPGAYRVFWCYGPKPEQVTIIAITPHP